MPTPRLRRLVWVLLGLAWWWAGTGLVSSNDGSHVALARALALRHETPIDPDVALTLWVDRSVREDRTYSDRPPGTALLALPAVWLGDRLDATFLARSRDSGELVVTPAGPRFAETYQARVERLHARAPPLLALQGTALLVGLHAMFVGLLGLIALDDLLARRGVSEAGRVAIALVVGAATLWGPYATLLFSHGTTATTIAVCLAALERGAATTGRRAAIAFSIAGLAGAWAVASDYLVALLVPALVLVSMPLRRLPTALPWLGLGMLPITAAVLAYHDAAFGSPLRIGYDFHANFDFARTRGSTFDGSLLEGLWTLWGAGHGAGVLVRGPVLLLGVLGLALAERRLMWAALPWCFMLALHHTPWGGASQDYRYLVPLVPVLALGLGHAWTRAHASPHARVWIAAGTALTLVSVWTTWAAFLAAR